MVGKSRRSPRHDGVRFRLARARTRPQRSRLRATSQGELARYRVGALSGRSGRPQTIGAAVMRILLLAHNHPDLHPGGTEIFARDLFEAYKRTGVEALFVAATNALHREPRPGTSFQTIGTSGD